MHLEQLQLILDLAQTHSFNQTAERHYTTQQSVSYSIKQLEKELNTQIFTRSKSGVSFTQEGEYVLQYAQQINEAYQLLLQKLGREKSAETPPKKISVATASVLVTDIMSNIIKAFSRECSSTKLRIKELSNEAVVSSLLNGSCDIVIWFINHRYLEKNILPQDAEKISFRLIQQDHSLAVISAASSLAQKSLLSFEDISRAPKSIFGLLPIDFFGKNTDSYVSYSNDNPAIHQQLILENNTICFTSETMYKKFFLDDRFLALPFDYPTLPNYHMILRRKETQSPVYDILESIIIKQFPKK